MSDRVRRLDRWPSDDGCAALQVLASRVSEADREGRRGADSVHCACNRHRRPACVLCVARKAIARRVIWRWVKRRDAEERDRQARSAVQKARQQQQEPRAEIDEGGAQGIGEIRKGSAPSPPRQDGGGPAVSAGARSRLPEAPIPTPAPAEAVEPLKGQSPSEGIGGPPASSRSAASASASASEEPPRRNRRLPLLPLFAALTCLLMAGSLVVLIEIIITHTQPTPISSSAPAQLHIDLPFGLQDPHVLVSFAPGESSSYATQLSVNYTNGGNFCWRG